MVVLMRLFLLEYSGRISFRRQIKGAGTVADEGRNQYATDDCFQSDEGEYACHKEKFLGLLKLISY